MICAVLTVYVLMRWHHDRLAKAELKTLGDNRIKTRHACVIN